MKKISLVATSVGLLATVSCSAGQPTDLTAPQSDGASASITTADIRVLVNNAIAQGKAGRLDDAKASLDMALSIDDTNKVVWYNLGVVAQMRDHVDEAIRSYDRALARDKAYTPAMYNKAILLEKTDPQQAMEIYQKIVTIKPNASTTFVRLGLLQLKGQQLDDARRNFAQAVRLDPSLRKEIPEPYRSETE